MTSLAAGPPSNLGRILASLGRASTPAVPKNPHGLTRGALMRLAENQAGIRAVVVGAPSLVDQVDAILSAAGGIPGTLREQVGLPLVHTLLIDWDAFVAGPWLAANSHAAPALLEELVDAAGLVRAAGGTAYALPRRPLRATGDERLLRACRTDLTQVPAVDLEEQAVQSGLWTLLAAEAAARTHPDSEERI